MKLGDGIEKVVTKAAAKLKMEPKVEVSFIDSNIDTVSIDEKMTQLSKQHLKFDFNSKTDFSPDNDS